MPVRLGEPTAPAECPIESHKVDGCNLWVGGKNSGV